MAYAAHCLWDNLEHNGVASDRAEPECEYRELEAEDDNQARHKLNQLRDELGKRIDFHFLGLWRIYDLRLGWWHLRIFRSVSEID